MVWVRPGLSAGMPTSTSGHPIAGGSGTLGAFCRCESGAQRGGRANLVHCCLQRAPLRFRLRPFLLLSFMKTYVANTTDRNRDWVLIDATGLTLGRLATQIADLLRGKAKPEFTPHVDTGDFVVIINAEKIAVTGKKRAEKMYYRHSGYPGGLKERTLDEMLERRPEEVIRKAVKGMLPKNRLARKQLTKLKVYAGADHPHAAQQPKVLEINT